MLEIIQKAPDSEKIACGIFLDLEKAFDTQSHDILLEKLNHCGFQRHLKWFNSDYKIIKWGSVLDPLLFLIFISDFNIAIKHCDTFVFADDTCLLNIQDSRK